MRKLMKHAAVDNDALKRTLDQIWEKPEDYPNLTLEYKKLEELRKGKEIAPSFYRSVVEEGTIKKFREYIENHKLVDAIDVIKAITASLGAYDSVIIKMKKILLTEAWHIDESSKLPEKISIFNKYVKIFPIKEDYQVREERDRLYNDIKAMIEEDIMKVKVKDEPKKTTRRQKGIQDLEKVVEDKPIQLIMEQRDPEMYKELAELF
jgi:hypothetical protein